MLVTTSLPALALAGIFFAESSIREMHKKTERALFFYFDDTMLCCSYEH